MRRERFMWRVLLFTGGYLLGLYALSWGQPTTLTADIAKASLQWQWTQGTEGPVEKWQIRCNSPQAITQVQVELVAPTARSIPIPQIITAVGTWTCTIAAVNVAGPSSASPAVTFTAGRTLTGYTILDTGVR